MGEAPLQVKVEEVQGVGIRGERNVTRRKGLLYISKILEKNPQKTNFPRFPSVMNNMQSHQCCGLAAYT